jgi:hypothetical protein
MAHQEEHNGKARWYDQRPITAKAIDLLEQLPRHMQDIVAKGVHELTENEFSTSTKMRSVRSLGKDKVLGLYAAKRRLRYMDELPSFHNCVVHLYVLDEDAQDFMAEKIIEMMEFVRSYLKSCKDYEEEAQQDDIVGITHTYIDKGGDEAEKFLKKLEMVLIEKVNRRQKGAPRKRDTDSAHLKSSDKGMKLRGIIEESPSPAATPEADNAEGAVQSEPAPEDPPSSPES